MRAKVCVSSVVLAGLLAFGSAPASASTISLLSADGHFRFIYDDSQASVVGRTVSAGGASISTINVNLNCVCLSTRPPGSASFAVNLLAQFIPEPGFVFSSINAYDPGPLGFSWGDEQGAGYQFSASTTITSLNNLTTLIVPGPTLSNFPPNFSSGGGALSIGIDLGTVAPPGLGFNLNLTQNVSVFGTSSFGLTRVQFDVLTVAAPPVGPGPAQAPEPSALILVGTGLLGCGRVIAGRRRWA